DRLQEAYLSGNSQRFEKASRNFFATIQAVSDRTMVESYVASDNSTIREAYGGFQKAKQEVFQTAVLRQNDSIATMGLAALGSGPINAGAVLVPLLAPAVAEPSWKDLTTSERDTLNKAQEKALETILANDDKADRYPGTDAISLELQFNRVKPFL